MALALRAVGPVAFDALLKRYFPAVVLALIAIAAYFQASGAMHLLGAAFTPDSAALGTQGAARPAVPGAAAAARGVSPREKSAEPILARNAFDSVTGPLTGETITIAKPTATVDLSNPLAAPNCDGMRVA